MVVEAVGWRSACSASFALGFAAVHMDFGNNYSFAAAAEVHFAVVDTVVDAALAALVIEMGCKNCRRTLIVNMEPH